MTRWAIAAGVGTALLLFIVQIARELGRDVVAEGPGGYSGDIVDHLTPELRIRIHERIQEASGLISQAEDELPRGDEIKEELRELGKRVWEIGYEILGDAKYVPVDELAMIIADLDEAEPFLDGAIDSVDLADAASRRVAERILAALHGRGET